MVRTAEQGPKQESIQDWNISIKNFGYSVKFDVRKNKGEKIDGFYRNVILLPRMDLEKILAHCDDL